MALSNKKFMLAADSIVNGTRAATHTATITLGEKKELSVSTRYIDETLCKNNETDIVADQNNFEAFAYDFYTGKSVTTDTAWQNIE